MVCRKPVLAKKPRVVAVRSTSMAAVGSSSTSSAACGTKVFTSATRTAKPRMSRVDPDNVAALCPSTTNPSVVLVTRERLPRISLK